MSVAFERALGRLAERCDHTSMASVAADAPSANVAQLGRLTRILADSGEHLTGPSPEVVDIASSGGPGSLSTLLSPLYACALGARVSKIGVPGRPAGGLDVLASLPGYRPDLGARAARRILDACGYVHVGAGEAFCPLDARFFSWRQENGAQSIPNLAITSLLSKKLAAGVGRFVLDIRVGSYGNFGTTPDEARQNAERLIKVAAELGIQAICVLTQSEGAAQPWIGRGEALLALGDVLYGDPDERLLRHAAICVRMAGLASGAADAVPASALAARAITAHETMLTAHGSSPELFWSRRHAIANAPRHSVIAKRSGLLRVDLGEIRRLLAERQRAARPVAQARFSDPSGVYLVASHGARVAPGAVLASVRDDDDRVHLGNQVAEHLDVVDASADAMTDAPMEIVRG